MSKPFKLISPYKPSGDQPTARDELCAGLADGLTNQVLLGVTGSGKTYTMALIIEKMQRPALVLCHNKTLAAQIYGEMKEFFPENSVEYFVSHFDYYQPEAYIPKTDLYIEKDSAVNEQIDRMRHAATRSLLERRDTIIVASVSCIYGIGSPEVYGRMIMTISKNQELNRQGFLRDLTELQYRRNDTDFQRGAFRVKGDIVDVYPSHAEDAAWRLSFFGDQVEEIYEFDPLTGHKFADLNNITIYPNSHYVTPRPTMLQAIKGIREEFKLRHADLIAQNKLVEAQRLEQRTQFDLEMIETVGVCKGIENYSRYLTGRPPGFPPPTLMEYLPKDAIFFIDESHASVPQIGGMYNGDRARKSTLVEHGFRLPSAMDNRPLKFEEFDAMRPQTVFVSATPAKYELELTGGKYSEQIIRPTGLIDPEVLIRPAEYQVDDLIGECKEAAKKNQRVLVTVLTKKMAESLTEYMQENGIKVEYLHSDIETLDRIEIVRNLRRGDFDVLVGINLLREGLDIPECGLVAILDADKEGFLRSGTSLIQTIGRAARNIDGRVILYADKMTDSIKKALDETDRRRKKQSEHNLQHGITPQGIRKKISEIIEQEKEEFLVEVAPLPTGENLKKHLEHLRRDMLRAAGNLDFEEAARLRDEIHRLESHELGVAV